MLLEGIHHITAITADGPANVDFYARVLGLRLVKQTVNQDDPTAYHLFYADEGGSPGADLTFFEYPGAQRGVAGAGMVDRIVHRVGSAEALDFWAARLGGEGVAVERDERSLRFADHEGLGHELVVATVPDAPLIARSLEVPAEHALQGFEAVHALVASVAPSEQLYVEGLGMARFGEGGSSFEARGEKRGGRIELDVADQRGHGGAGTVHHVAWSIGLGEEEAWRERVIEAGMQPTPVIDRFYFHSVYFREPGGILFELATRGPGFAVDEEAEHVGERLSLPPSFEGMRERLGTVLTPLPDTRGWRPTVV
jgi:glyoxalase family protein